jgi:hypothetical protein
MQWEYLIVQYLATAREERGKLVWTQQYNIGHPSGKPQSRRGDQVSLSSMLNELGSQGWELVAETVLETKAFGSPEHRGATHVPIEIHLILKRPLPGSQPGGSD